MALLKDEKIIEEKTLTGYCRVDFVGGTTDLWPLYCHLNRIRVINMAIPVSSQVTVEFESSPYFLLQIESKELNCKSIHKSLQAIEKDLLKDTKKNPLRWLQRLALLAFQKSGKSTGIWKIKVRSDAPPGSGLGGSSTLGITVLKLMLEMLGVPEANPWVLHQMLYFVEAAEIEKPAGEQDSVPALFGGLLSFTLSAHERSVEHYPNEIARSLAGRCALIHTGKPHHSGINNWDVFKKYHDGNKSVQKALKSISELADEMHDCLVENKLEKFIGLINKEWEFRKKLSKTFDVPVLRQAWTFAKSKGAVARKACGAGGGGSLLVVFKNKDLRDKAIMSSLPKKEWIWIPLACVESGLYEKSDR